MRPIVAWQFRRFVAIEVPRMMDSANVGSVVHNITALLGSFFAETDADKKRGFHDEIRSRVLEIKGWDRVERPKPSNDNFAGAYDLIEESFKKSITPARRQLLTQVFIGLFTPRFFYSGMSELLARHAMELRYPDLAFLAEMIRQQKQSKAITVLVKRSSISYYHAQRLAKAGLIDPTQKGDELSFVACTEQAMNLCELLWGDEFTTAKAKDLGLSN